MTPEQIITNFYSENWYQVERLQAGGEILSTIQSGVIPDLNLRRRGSRLADLSPAENHQRWFGTPEAEKIGERDELEMALANSSREITPEVLHELADAGLCGSRPDTPPTVLWEVEEIKKRLSRAGVVPAFLYTLAFWKYSFRNRYGDRPDIKQLELKLLTMVWDGDGFYHPN